MDEIFANLNEPQKEAVLTTTGPVMVIAGAGSGKTRVLTRRMAHLIANLNVPAHNVLAITFTNKAASEMKERIGSLLNRSTRTLWISTFHSMCARILRSHIELLGYHRHFHIVDDDDVNQLINIALKRLNIDKKLIKARALKPYIMNMKTDSTFLDAIEEPLKGYLESVFPVYQKHLKDNNLVDFEDLMILTIELLKKHLDVKQYYHEQFQYILVDEFQDTNDIQYQLIKLLTNENRNIFVVGDEDQSIYAFRGANIDNIRKFERDFQNVKRILLEQNYRSTNQILNAANSVIKYNYNRIEKTLYSKREEGLPITFFKAYTYRDEADYIAEIIKHLTRMEYSYEDIAILYRANSTSRVFEETLMQKKIPYRIIGNIGFFKRKEIKDIVAYLRLIINPHDNYSFGRVVNEPRRGIGAKTIDTLSTFAEFEGMSLYDAIESMGNPLSKASNQRIASFVNTIKLLTEHLNTGELSALIDHILEETNYKESLKFDEMGEIRLENILELKTMIAEISKTHQHISNIDLLTELLQEIALKSQEDELKDPNVVTLMTLHAAKGLEYKVVFIVALEQGVFPLYRMMDSKKDIEEERRLMYVGMTRAMDKLYLTNAKQRMLYGNTTMNQDSMFLREIDMKDISIEGLNKAIFQQSSQWINKPSKPILEETWEENVISKGDKVNHDAFGKGVVVSVEGNQCTIAFAHPHGVKKLLKDHPALKLWQEEHYGQ